MPGIGYTPAIPPPQGGTVAQVLGKNSSTNYDVSWRDLPASIMRPVYTSGTWYTNSIAGGGSTISGGQSLTASRSYYVPFTAASTVSVSGLGLNITSAPTSTPVTLSMALLSNSGSLPGTLLASAVSTSVSNAGFATAAYSATVPAGLNYFAFYSDLVLPIASAGPESSTASPYPEGNQTSFVYTYPFVWGVYTAATIASNPSALTYNSSGTSTPIVYFRIT